MDWRQRLEILLDADTGVLEGVDWSRVEATFTVIAKAHPDLLVSFLSRSQIRKGRGDLEGARVDLETVLARTSEPLPEDTQPLDAAQYYTNRAEAAYGLSVVLEKEDPDQAIAYATHAFDLVQTHKLGGMLGAFLLIDSYAQTARIMVNAFRNLKGGINHARLAYEACETAEKDGSVPRLFLFGLQKRKRDVSIQLALYYTMNGEQRKGMGYVIRTGLQTLGWTGDPQRVQVGSHFGVHCRLGLNAYDAGELGIAERAFTVATQSVEQGSTHYLAASLAMLQMQQEQA